MTTPNNYTPASATGTGSTVTVPIPWPFSGSLTDLYVYQQNVATGEIRYEQAGDFVAQVRQLGQAFSVVVDNFYGAGTAVRVFVNRSTALVQSYAQPDGEALDPYAVEAALDLIVRANQELSGPDGEGPVTSLDPYSIPNAATRANTFHAFDASGNFLGVAFIPNDGVVWISSITGTPVASKMRLTGASPVALSILDASVEISNGGGPLNMNLLGNLKENGIDVFTRLPAGTPNRVVTIDSAGTLVTSELDYSAGVLQLFNRDYLTLRPGPGIDGMNLTLEGNTEASELNLTGQSTSIKLKASTSLAELITNTALNLDAANIHLFRGLPGQSKALRVWGGAAGTDGSLDISVNATTTGRADFKGTGITDYNFVGNLLQNGVPIVTGLAAAQYKVATFDAGDLATDAEGDYYLFAHNFNVDSPVNIVVYDSLHREVNTTNVKNPDSPSTLKNSVKIYVDGYTPLVGTYSASAFTGTPQLTTPGQLTGDQVAAINNSPTPGNALNPFVTVADVPGNELTPDEKAAIQGATLPSGTNVFLTEQDQQLSPDQLAAIDNAPTPPSALNPFATVADRELSPDQLAAVVNAPTPATGANPFTTVADKDLTAAQVAAINSAPTAATGANPFVTVADIPPQLLTSDELAAIQGAIAPSAGNYFVTRSQLPFSIAVRVARARFTIPDIGAGSGNLPFSNGINISSVTYSTPTVGTNNVVFTIDDPLSSADYDIHTEIIADSGEGGAWGFLHPPKIIAQSAGSFTIQIRETYSAVYPMGLKVTVIQYI